MPRKNTANYDAATEVLGKNMQAKRESGSDLLAEFNAEAESAASEAKTAATKAGKTPRTPRAAKPEVSALERVLAVQEKGAQGRNVKRILGRVAARVNAGQDVTEAMDAVFAQLREAVAEAITDGKLESVSGKKAARASAPSAMPTEDEEDEDEAGADEAEADEAEDDSGDDLTDEEFEGDEDLLDNESEEE